MNPLLRLQNVSYTYHTLAGETPVLSNVSFDVLKGEFVAIVGPSGCGKSTLLSLIAGLFSPNTGSIYIEENPIFSSDKKVGYMLQKDHLLEWRSLDKNLMLGLEIQNKMTKKHLQMKDQLLQTYGLYQFKQAHPSALSGGMRQRAALIRTLLLEPDLLLLDEPFSALDYQTRLEVSDDIYRIIKKEQKSALLITHDISEAVSMADKVIVLSKRPATVLNIIDIHLSLSERTPILARSAPEFNDYFHLIWDEMMKKKPLAASLSYSETETERSCHETDETT